MGCRDDHLGCTVFEQGLRRLHNRATGVDHVVDDDANSILDVTHDLKHSDLSWGYRDRDACE